MYQDVAVTMMTVSFYQWILKAMECGGLLELHLHASPLYYCVYLERKLFTSNTLVKLTLSGDYDLEFESVFLPSLKSLSLLSVFGLDYPNHCRLLYGCPALEDLFIRDADHSDPPCCGAVVESESLKRLVVFVDLPDSQDSHDALLFRTPSLVYIDYSSYVSSNYQFDDLNLLVEARLSLKLWESTHKYDYSDDDDHDSDYDFYYDVEPKAPIFGDVTNLVAGITNITTLHLSPDSLEVFHFCCESMPVFTNLLNLSIKGLVHRVTNRCGDACACVPGKKRKIVKEEELCWLSTCQVKVLVISEYGGSFKEVNMMRHFLDKLECLVNVKVGVYVVSSNREFLRANLLTLPRFSPICNIQFI